MAHEILGSRFIGRSRPAWHGIGQVFDENKDLLVSEAVKSVAGDITVEAEPIFYLNSDGAHVPVDNYQAIVRRPTKDDPNEKFFGVTTEKWHGVNYPEIAKALDELGKTYKIETAGVIQDGSLCFVSLRGPDFSVSGDEMRDYFIANLSNQPGNSHKVLAAPVRVVCFNTNMMAQERASISLSVSHSSNAAEKIALAANLVARFKEMTQRTHDIFSAFAKVQIDKAGVDRIAKAAFPDPTLPAELRMFQYTLTTQEEGALRKILGPRFGAIVSAQNKFDNAKERTVARRGVVLERFEEFDPKHLRGTVWAAYNAATEVSDWRQGRGAEVASVWGNRAQEKAAAFSEAFALAGLN